MLCSKHLEVLAINLILKRQPQSKGYLNCILFKTRAGVDTEFPTLADLVASSPAGRSHSHAGPRGPRALLAVLEGHGAAGAAVDAGGAGGRASGQAHPAAPATGGNKEPFNRAFTKQTTFKYSTARVTYA